MIDDYDDTILLWKQLASKFSSLKKIEIKCSTTLDLGLFTFWQLLNPIIKKNNCQTELIPHETWDIEKWKYLVVLVNEKHLKIDKMEIQVGVSYLHSIFMPNLNHLTICTSHDREGILPTINFMSNSYLSNKQLFKSLRVIEIKGSVQEFRVINDILTSMEEMIIDKQLFVIITLIKKNSFFFCEDDHDDASQFEILCKNMHKLIIKKRMAMDIKVTIESRREGLFAKCNTIFQSHFGDVNFNCILLKQYKEPSYSQMVGRRRNYNKWSYWYNWLMHISNCSKKE